MKRLICYLLCLLFLFGCSSEPYKGTILVYNQEGQIIQTYQIKSSHPMFLEMEDPNGLRISSDSRMDKSLIDSFGLNLGYQKNTGSEYLGGGEYE